MRLAQRDLWLAVGSLAVLMVSTTISYQQYLLVVVVVVVVVEGPILINIDMQRRLKAVQRERANFPVVSDTGLANEIISIVKENNRGLGRSVGSIITEVKRLHRIPDRTILHEIDLAINRGSLIYPLKGDDNDIVAIPGFIEDVYTYLSSVDFQPVETLVSDLCTYLPIIYPATLYTFDDIVTRVRFLVKLGYLTANSVLEVKLGARST